MTIHPSDSTPNQVSVIYTIDLHRDKQVPKPRRVKLSSILFGVFLILVLVKQLHVLEVSWWWICLPIYLIPAGYGLLIIVIFLIWLGQELQHRLRIR
ncbi:hypothetical protein GO755_00540 [Spirosoma sp. HMF4905]|uniref:Transmembrane protein n=1 Tax=Spirosoma arboris TaxID=2682092 RepID=A0A7K1S4J5_9BACT|nr:hypothetical protein [Spirosoma arboris]MVM28498.1 hypothetical protein [Spirosoma arboris]